MKHYKGLLCGLAAVVLALGAVRIVSLNKALPSPEDKPVTVGEKFIYKGLEGTVGDVEIYNKEEMQTAYTLQFRPLRFRSLRRTVSLIFEQSISFLI